MLVNIHSQMMRRTIGLADDSALCAQEGTIIALFDQLLKKLGGEVTDLPVSAIKYFKLIFNSFRNWH